MRGVHRFLCPNDIREVSFCSYNQGTIGRPRFVIKRQQLLTFGNHESFMWVDIAEMLSVSISTLNRHRERLGVITEEAPPFSDISEANLERVLSEISFEASRSVDYD